MGELTDKTKGNLNEAAGKAKQAMAGDPAHRTAADDRMAADGAAQETVGKGQQLKGKVKGMLGDDI
jgi:uncharacterized protein YjbJ (UPF0337 family)